MTDIVAKKLRLYRTAPARGAKPKVDHTGGDFGQGLIRGAAVVTRGEALGHGEWIDEEFVSEVGKRINSSNRGVKMRFTHPSLSGDGLGTFLGRAKNGATDSERTLADIHFSKASHNTPDGDLAAYVMNLAEEDPEAFGVSIVYEPDLGAEDRFIAEHEDEDGRFRSPDEDNAHNYPHARMSNLRAADVVDDPAANPGGLFHRGQEVAEEADALCEYALGISDKKPELQLLSADADRIAGFAARFMTTRNLELRTKQMATDKPTDATAVTIEQFNALKAETEALKAQLAKPETSADTPDAVAAERKRCLEIGSLAEKSGLDGFTQLANDAISGGLTVEQFGQAIAQRRIASNGVTKDSGQQPDDPYAEFRKEYRETRDILHRLNPRITEDSHIRSRCRDKGIPVPEQKPAA